MNDDLPDEVDAAVIGAGPAGSVLARELARRGLTVVLIERAAFPRRKVCGACLGGHAVRGLTAAGLGHVLTEHAAVPLTAFRLGVGGRRRRAVTVRTGGGFALSRAAFDAALAAEAAAAGAAVLFGTTAGLRPDRTLTLTRGGASHPLRAGAVAVACGLRGVGSALRTVPGDRAGAAAGLGAGPTPLASRVRPGSRVGAGCGVPAGGFDRAFFAAGTIHMAVAAGGYVGATVTERGELNLAGAFDLPCLKANGGPAGAAAAILEAAGFPLPPGLTAADWTGTPPLTRAADDVVAGGVFLIGDAAGYVEPFTGEGMGWAVASARAAAEPVAASLAGDPTAEARWRGAYRREVGRRKRWCRAVAAAARTPRAAGAAALLLSRFPAAAAPLVRHLAG